VLGLSMLLAFLVSFLLSLHFSKLGLARDNPGAGPQKINPVSASRMGGVAVYLALVISSLIFDNDFFRLFLLTVLPTFLVAFYEDFFQNVRPSIRLIIAFISGALFVGLTGYYVMYVNIPVIDSLLKFNFVALSITIFAIAGVVNAFNIIDGLNGLAGGTAFISFLFLGFAALEVKDTELVFFAILFLMALLGFLVHNYPRCKILLGDSGAYLLGFLVATYSLLLVYRNPSISPWFPLVLIFYPVFETLFSIYRRIFVKRKGAMEADFRHLHSILFRRYVKENPCTTRILLLGFLLNAVLAYFLRHSTFLLLILLALNIVIYLVFYKSMLHFKAGWLRKVKKLVAGTHRSRV
jgi:UDP-N-acetylmuramyl pentapeptide phosphotransferase/UDP-N-acetylglucosamine-1-phosphate transferase